MKDFIHSVKFKILAGIVALLLGIMIYAASTEGGVSIISSALGAVVRPVQKLSTAISNKVSTTLDMLMNADKYYDENKKLKDKLDDLYIDIVDYENIKEENEHYKEVLGLKEEYPDYKFSAPCQVIGRTPNDIYQSFSIDKGKRDGISLYDPVITAKGQLIGIVSDVEVNHATVTTILSPKFKYSVIAIKAKEPGVLEGNYDFADKGFTRMKYVTRGADIQKGDVIVTTGQNGLVPENRSIGTVDSVELEKGGLSLEVKVKPSVEISSIKNVFVITEFEGQGEGYDN